MRRTEAGVAGERNDVAFVHSNRGRVKCEVDGIRAAPILFPPCEFCDCFVVAHQVCVRAVVTIGMPHEKHLPITVRLDADAVHVTVIHGKDLVPFCPVGADIDAAMKVHGSIFGEGGGDSRACIRRPDIVTVRDCRSIDSRWRSVNRRI